MSQEAPLRAGAIEIAGDWYENKIAIVRPVVELIRRACFDGIALRSDRQPARLRLEHRPVEYPAIWLHDADPHLAWMIVVIGTNDWCQLAYEFGHELGHVFGNSWDRHAVPLAPCQWLEESIAEAFALRGLARLEQLWPVTPPADVSDYNAEIARYRHFHLRRNRARIARGGIRAWFRAARARLETMAGDAGAEAPMTLATLRAIELHPDWAEDIGALNRWPERSAAPLPQYLRLWCRSCAELGTPGELPRAITRWLGSAG